MTGAPTVRFWRRAAVAAEGFTSQRHQAGVIRTTAACGLLCIVALTAFLATLKTTGPQLGWDGSDYAQIARQVFRHKGQTTEVTTMEFVPELARHHLLLSSWPNVFRPPVPVFAMAFFFRLLGATDLVAVLWSGVFYIGTVVLIFWSFEPVTGATTAFLSALVFAVSSCGLVYARSGLTEPSAMFFLLLAFGLAVRFHGTWTLSLAGASLGFCSLSRPVADAWVLVLATCVVIQTGRSLRDRTLRAGAVLTGFLVPVIAAHRFLHWQEGEAALGINLAYRVGNASEAMARPVSFALHHSLAILNKFAYELARPVVYGFRFGDVLLFSSLAPFGLLLHCRDSASSFARRFVVASIVVTAVGLAFLSEGDAFAGPLRYFDVFAPLLVPWGVSALLILFRARPHLNTAFAVIFAMYIFTTAFQAIRDPFAAERRAMVPIYADVKNIVPPADIVLATGSVNPPALAWYADRRTIFVFAAERDAAELEDNHIYPAWLLARDSDPLPSHFLEVKRWPGGFLLLRNNSNQFRATALGHLP